MTDSATAILTELKARSDSATAAQAQRYFKTGKGEYGEGDRFLGIRAQPLRQLAKAHRETALDDVVRLLASPYHEARSVALLILVHAYQKGDAARRAAIFDLYLRNTARINGWDLVDVSAPHIVGAHLGPGRHALLTRLAKSKSLWERRIAMLATMSFIRHDYYDETLRIARLLLHDEHDLIHKAVGWMLREIGNRDRACEETFLREYAAVMPRTMLRYAIEKFPEPLRRQYLRVR